MAEINFQRIKGYTYCTYCKTIFDARQQSRWCKHTKEYWEPIYTIGTPVRPAPKKSANTVEMLTGPNNKKVFSHIHHNGVKAEAEQFDPKKE